MHQQLAFAALLGVYLAVVRMGADDSQAAQPALPELLPREREVALAKSAGLPAWTSEATIYVLERGGYVVAQPGSNGFSCLVGRERPDTLEPLCFDPEGTRTILPRVLHEAKLREQGKTTEEIEVEINRGFRRGHFRAPSKPGVSYMLSPENRVFNGREVIWFPPHLMVYAPYATNEEIGAAPREMPRSPWVLNEGDPHAYIIVVVPSTMPAQEK